MARKSKEDAEETRKNIIDSAIELFLNKGVSSTTLNDIAENAGVTRGAIYWHFKDKTDILADIFSEVMNPIDTLAREIINDEAKTILDLKEHLKFVLKDIIFDKRKADIMSILLTRLDYSDQYKDFFNEHNVSHCKLLDATSIFFDKLQKKGTISTKFSARMIASSMHCFLSGLLTEHFRSEKDVMLKDHYGEYIEVFFAQIIN